MIVLFSHCLKPKVLQRKTIECGHYKLNHY